MIFNLDDNEINDKYKLMAQTIIPRPISVGHKSDGTPKDTLSNIRKNKKCTICMVDENSLEKMHFSSKELDKELSEADTFKIQTQSIFDEYPAMIKDVPAAYFCEFNQEIDLGGGFTIPIVLNVKQIFVKDECITNKERMTIEFNPVARIGKSYAFLGEEITPPKIP